MHSSRLQVYPTTPLTGTHRDFDAVLALWNALCESHQDLVDLDLDGVHTVHTRAGVSVRWAADRQANFIACEVVDLPAGDAWEAFVLRLPDGRDFTGWGRRGAAEMQPPEPWIASVADLTLGPQTAPSVEPTFLELAATFCASKAPALSQADFQARQSLSSELDHWRSLSSSQAASIRSLRAALEARNLGESGAAGDAGVTEQVSRELTLDDLPGWAEANVDRIVILPRALSGAKKSGYLDIEKLYAALEMLSSTYRLVKESALPRERLKQEADALGLSIGGSVEVSRAGMMGEEYFVSYGGRRRFLDQHLRSGSSRDPRFALRIYYTWCEETRRVVVGSMPGHLRNSMS